MRSRWERGFAVGLGVLLLALAIAAQMLQSGTKPVAGSVASSDPDGRRALSLLLEGLGFRAEPWRDPPGALPSGGPSGGPSGAALLWLARAPERPGSGEDEEVEEASADEDETEKAPPSPGDLGFRAPSRYRRFVEEGGTLLLPHSESTRAFLVDELGLDSFGDVRASSDAAEGVRTVRDEAGEDLEVEIGKGGVVLAPESGSAARALWRDGDEVLALAIPVERGQVVLLGSDGFLDNARIGAHDHALFAVRLAEEFAPEGRVLFDEYALGLWEPRSPIGFLASPRLFLASFHAVLLLLLLTLRSAWVREFPRDPAPHASASPLLRARTLAGLLARANRQELLTKHLREANASPRSGATSIDTAAPAR